MMPKRVYRFLWTGWLVVPFVAATVGWAQPWDELSPSQRYDTMQKYREYEKLPPEKKEDIDKRYERWRRMPDAKRDRVLRNYERYRSMPPDERREFNRKYNRWRHDSAPSAQDSGGRRKRGKKNR
jgi:hypothetical protein